MSLTRHLPSWAQHWSVWALIAANLVPLGGVLFAGWSAFEVVFLYWLENLIIGFFNLGKIITVGAIGAPAGGELPGRSPVAARLINMAGACFFAGFFLFHYGIFTSVHGIFVVTLLAPDIRESMPRSEGLWGFLIGDTLYLALQSGFTWSFLTLFASHGFSFAYNFLYVARSIAASASTN
jgi:hypothetical protein